MYRHWGHKKHLKSDNELRQLPNEHLKGPNMEVHNRYTKKRLGYNVTNRKHNEGNYHVTLREAQGDQKEVLQADVTAKLDHLTDIGITLHEKYNIDVGEDTMFPYIINNPVLCSDRGPLYQVILVVTAPTHFLIRQMLRQTWAQNNLLKDYPSQTVFLIGNSHCNETQSALLKENETYGDIIQTDFKDSYHNITLKVLMGIKWVMRYCNNTRYVLRVNDDMFVDMINVVQIIEEKYPHANRTILGVPMFNVTVLRADAECNHKWCVGNEDHPEFVVYPPYANGNFFFLTSDILQELYQTALTINFFWIEDIFITGIVRQGMNDINVTSINPYFQPAVMKPFIEQYTNNEDNVRKHYVAIKTNTWTTPCIWAVRLLHLTEKEVSLIGGHENIAGLWNRLTGMTVHPPLYGQMSDFSVEHMPDTLFTFQGTGNQWNMYLWPV